MTDFYLTHPNASCPACMSPITAWLRTKKIKFEETDLLNQIKLTLPPQQQADLKKQAFFEQNNLSLITINPQHQSDHLAMTPSPHHALAKSLILAIPGITLMTLMLLGFSFGWTVLLLLGLISFLLFVATSHQWIDELGINSIQGKLSTNGFFAFCTITIWAISMASLLFPSLIGLVAAFDMVLILPAIRHLGIWIKALAYQKTEKPWRWHDQLRAGYATLPNQDQTYSATQGLVPVDSTATEECIINLKHICGENQDSTIQPGDTIPQGAILRHETTLIAQKNFLDSSVMAISQSASSHQKGSLEQWLAKSLNRYLWLVVTLAVATAIFWAIVNPAIALFSSLSVLLVACPCSLAMGIEMITKTTQSIALRHGIVFKHLDAILNLAKSDELFLDQVGTITEPGLERLDGDETNQMILYRLEQAILDHDPKNPYAKAILESNLFSRPPLTSSSIDIISSEGGFVFKEGRATYYLGSAHFIRNRMIPLQFEPDSQDHYLVSATGQCLSQIRFKQIDKSQTQQSLHFFRLLFKQGVHVITGSKDNTQLSRFKSSKTLALPKDKLHEVKQTQNATFLGDGLNDYAAQKEALCGVSYNQELEDIDVTLAEANPWGLVIAKVMANQCAKAVRWLLGLSIVYNVGAIILAAGVFFLVTGQPLSPMFAALMMLGSFLVIPCISLVLRWVHQRDIPILSYSSSASFARSSISDEEYFSSPQLSTNNNNDPYNSLIETLSPSSQVKAPNP